MTREKPAYDLNLVELAERVREALRRKGWSDARFEREAGLAGGSLSRLASGQRKRISQQSLKRIAEVLGESYLYIAFGVAVGPRLQEIPGYLDAEVEVARLEPDIPVAVIRTARTTRIENPPELITVDFLRDYVRTLAEHRIGPQQNAESSGERRRGQDAPERSGERRRQDSDTPRLRTAKGRR
jgi:transcriptional regulator with XRE-family HTH domain